MDQMVYYLVHLSIGPLILVISLIFRAFPPKKINHLYGYRTRRSMKSQEAWDEANEFSMKLLVWVSIGTIFLQVSFHFLFSKPHALLASCVALVALLLAVFPVVERHLKSHFDEEGNRISF